MASGRWVLYGANGYTGRLIAALAQERGERPVLAGRTEANLRPLARELGLEFRAVPLDDAAGLDDLLGDADAVLHVAGPFSRTSSAMMAACLRAKTSYLDITGEMRVFEAIWAQHDALVAAGISSIPGVGFDVVPTDCLAVMLRDALPGATRLELAISGLQAISPGTLTTALEGIGDGCLVRRGDRLTPVPFGAGARRIRFAHGERDVTWVPTADLVSAARSTGIPDIDVSLAVPRALLHGIGAMNLIRPIAATRPIQALGERLIRRFVAGPDAHTRQTAFSDIHGTVRDASGRAVSGSLTIAEAYHFTAHSALAAVQRVARGDVPPGAWTPAQAFGPEFVLSIEGSKLHGIGPV